MRRRQFLALTAASTPAVAGCGQFGAPPDRETYYVAPDGRDTNPGSRASPLEHLQVALERAKPGDVVHALPGRYHEVVETVRPGTPDNPITITGPPEAVFVGGDRSKKPEPLKIRHSHIRLTGLTFNGLQDPEHPQSLESYASANIHIEPRQPAGEPPPMLTDIVVTPHAAGNTRGNCMHVFFAEQVEVGECRVIGPAGVAHFLFDKPGHDGEIVYIGTAEHGWTDKWNGYVDHTRDVHVHHIDNSAGHKHAEIADAKAGTRNVTVEYFTSVGNVTGQPAIHLGGTHGVARWNRIRDAERTAITIGNWGTDYEQVPAAGTTNAVYGNHITGSTDRSITITPEVSAADQTYICGNTVDTPGHGTPEAACPDSVPTGDGVGHTGGNSPWG